MQSERTGNRALDAKEGCSPVYRIASRNRPNMKYQTDIGKSRRRRSIVCIQRNCHRDGEIGVLRNEVELYIRNMLILSQEKWIRVQGVVSNYNGELRSFEGK